MQRSGGAPTLERRDGMQSFARCEWCFLYSKNYEANSALTKLDLGGNYVGDAGAVALAEALKATVVTCGHDFREGALVCFWRWKQNQSDVKSCGVVQCSVRLAYFCYRRNSTPRCLAQMRRAKVFG